MLHSATFILDLIAFGLTIFAGLTNRLPLWIPLLLLTIAFMIAAIPA